MSERIFERPCLFSFSSPFSRLSLTHPFPALLSTVDSFLPIRSPLHSGFSHAFPTLRVRVVGVARPFPINEFQVPTPAANLAALPKEHLRPLASSTLSKYDWTRRVWLLYFEWLYGEADKANVMLTEVGRVEKLKVQPRRDVQPFKYQFLVGRTSQPATLFPPSKE